MRLDIPRIVFMSMKAMVYTNIKYPNLYFCENQKCIKTRKTGGLTNKGRPRANQIWLQIFFPNMAYSVINDDF